MSLHSLSELLLAEKSTEKGPFKIDALLRSHVNHFGTSVCLSAAATMHLIPTVLLAVVIGFVASLDQDMWSICQTLQKAQSIGIPGAGSCSTECEVTDNLATFKLLCGLNDKTSCAAKSGKLECMKLC